MMSDQAELKFVVSSSPHIRDRATVDVLMRDVVFALLPACFAALAFFGPHAGLLIGVSIVSAIAAEYLWQRATRSKVTVRDLSAVVTGLLLALNLPPGAPLWLPAVGSVFAIVVVKQLFGGLGHNFLNPALGARAMLMASWPQHMTAWRAPFDAVTGATPLAALVPKAGATTAHLPSYVQMFIGNIPGCIGETSALALLLGGIYLILRKTIDWRIPLGFIGTVAVMSWVLGPRGVFTGDPLAHVLLGGLMLGAFFMATDYVTSPVTPKGRLIMGIGCGVITVLIRLYGSYPEGVSYSILFMNLVTPLIDRYTVPRRLGELTLKRAARKAHA